MGVGMNMGVGMGVGVGPGCAVGPRRRHVARSGFKQCVSVDMCIDICTAMCIDK